LFHGIIHPDGFNPFPKNPNIRKFFTAFGWTDEIGSGIRNSNKYLPLYADGAKPVFYENDTFVTEIPLHHLTLAKFCNEFIAWLGLGKEAEDHLRAGLSNIALPATLSDATWEDLLLHLVPSWHQNGTQLAKLSWPDNQVFEDFQIKTVPSWSENGTQLLRKKVWYLITILSLCSEPVKFMQLLNYIGYKNEKSFREKYIKPLRDIGFIQLTNPENTTDPENKYCITDEGKAFLGGMFSS
jgi:ATP-dependent DNA helicase RecG